MPTALDYCRRYIPATVNVGERVSQLLKQVEVPMGLFRLLQSEANAGTQGAQGIHDQITKFGASSWPRLLPKLEFWLPRIRHWRFVYADYSLAHNREATWYIDPPYSNEAGSRYRQTIDHFPELGDWCKSRAGQVIVCENEGAAWLPFEPLAPRRGVTSSYQKSKAMEVVWTRCA